MNQSNPLRENKTKFLWLAIVLGGFFFLAAVSTFRPTFHRMTTCVSGSNGGEGSRWSSCIDPGIVPPPANLRLNPDSQGWTVPGVPPPQWNYRGFPPGRHSLPIFFDITPIDLTPVLKVLALVLALAALPALHGWLLGQAWRYMFPLDEANQALRLGWRASAGLTLLAIPVLGLWLSGLVSNLAVILGAVTAIVVATGMIVGIRTARRREFTDTFTRKLAVATGLLSLVVPASVTVTLLNNSNINTGGSIIGTLIWPIIATLALGFILFRRTITEYLDRFQALATRWQVDHLALEVLALFSLVLVPVSLFAGYLIIDFSSTEHFTWILLLALGSIWVCMLAPAITALPFVGMWTLSVFVSVYVAWRGRGLSLKKKASPLELHDTPLFDDNRWLRSLVKQTTIWLGGSVALSTLLLIAENLWLR